MRRVLIATFVACIGSNCLAEGKKINVAADGSGDYKTVQEAIAAVPDNSADATIIHIKAGTYQGSFFIAKGKNKISLEGDGAENTILTWSRNVKDPIPDGGDKFNPGLVMRADDFSISNITVENTSGDHGQALAVRLDGDREIITNCRFVGWQDTLMVNNGRSYFKDSYIAGRVDFIYGSGTAVFDHCEIHSRNGGHITAASTPEDHPFGLVFLNCKLTGDSIPWVAPATDPTSQPAPPRVTPIADLGRPWRPTGAVAYINCEMGEHISPAGWNNWGNPNNEKTARYSEYKSTGPGGSAEKRVAWAKQLSEEEAAKYTVSNILAGSDSWNPASAATTQAATQTAN